MKHLYIYIVIFLILPMVAQGQDTVAVTNPTDTLTPTKIEVDEVEVIKEFEVTLGEARRIDIGPKLQPKAPVDKTYSYDITIVPMEISYPDPVIKPLAMDPDKKPDVDHFFAKVGYGSMSSGFGDISFYRNVPELYTLMIDGDHRMLDNTSNISNQKFSDSNLRAHATYLLGENTNLHGGVSGGYEIRGYFDTLAIVSTEVPSQRDLLKLGAHLGVSNAEAINGLNYKAIFAGQRYSIESADQDGSEVSLHSNLGVSKKLSSLITVSLSADGYMDVLTTDQDSNYTFYTVDAVPSITFTKGNFTLVAGAGIVADSDKTDLFPEAEARLRVGSNFLVFAGAEQQLVRNNFITSSQRIPYITLSDDLLTNTIINRIYSGIKGKILSKLSFDLVGAYETINNMYHYTDNPSLPHEFNINFIEEVKNINIEAQAEFELTENTSLGAKLNHNFFDVPEGEVLQNISAFYYEAFTKLQFLDDRLQLTSSLGLMDRIDFINTKGVTESGEERYDLNVALDFYLTKSIGIWAKGNNLLNNKYLEYMGYPTAGIHVQGGVIVKI